MRNSRVPALLFAAPVLMAAVIAHTDLHAGCMEPAPEIIWSYPADGETGVPTNTLLWFVTSSGVAEVRLDGEVIGRKYLGIAGAPSSAHDPGALEPNADYVLDVLVGSGEHGEVPQEAFTLVFRTGDGPLEVGPGPIEILGAEATADWDYFDSRCRKVVSAQDCYDHGGDTHVILNVDQEALLYLVSSRKSISSTGYMAGVRWPGVCGDPSRFYVSTQEACYRVHAVGPSGLFSSTEEVCLHTADLPLPGTVGSDDRERALSCASSSVSGLRGSLAALLAVSFLLLGGRPSRAPRRHRPAL